MEQAPYLQTVHLHKEGFVCRPVFLPKIPIRNNCQIGKLAFLCETTSSMCVYLSRPTASYMDAYLMPNDLW